MLDLQDNTFMLPGPVKMHPRVLDAMSKPALSHRSKDFEAVNGEIRELLQFLFQTKNDVAVISGSGTAGTESVITSLFKKNDKILNLTNGKFGERLFEQSQVFASPIRMDAPWGKPFDLDKLAKVLEEQRPKGLTLCHNETSTGMTNQAKEIGTLAKKYNVMFILDGITSVGGIDVRMDEWGADAVILGSQKCLAAPAGLAAIAVSKRAMESMYSDNNYYLNLKKHVEKLRANDTPYTPAIPLFLALREALRMLKEEGLENRFRRIETLAKATRAGVKALGLQLYPDERFASNTVTAINYPPGITDKDFRGTLRDKYGVVIAGAQDQIKNKVFRIGHMGICSFSDLIATFAAIEAVLKKSGVAVKPGSGVGAIEEFM